MRIYVLPLILCACGRIGFDAQPDSDAAVDGPIDSGPDAIEPDAKPAFATGPFETATPVEELANPAFEEDDPTLTGDMLEIYFKTAQGAGIDIYGATRASITDLWSTPLRIDELSSPQADDTPEVSFDGLTMHLASNRDGNTDIYRSVRASRQDLWSTPVLVGEVSSPGADYAATTDGAGLHLIMNRSDMGNLQLFAAERALSTDPWSTPTPLSELNTPRYEADAVLDERGLVLFYTTVEADGVAQRQVYSSERSDLTSDFEIGVPVAGVNTDEHDEDPWISPDLSVLYFSRTVAGQKKLFMATRPL